MEEKIYVWDVQWYGYQHPLQMVWKCLLLYYLQLLPSLSFLVLPHWSCTTTLSLKRLSQGPGAAISNPSTVTPVRKCLRAIYVLEAGWDKWSGGGRRGKKKKRKKRDCCWRFRRTPKATSNALNVHHFKWWHSHIFSNWFFKRLNYTRTK